jgi:hypothetical protein
MAGPRPDRTKTMPQTSGEASAAYHAEHAVRAGQAPREDEARKVLVDTVRVPVAKPLDEDTGPLFDKLAARADPTYVVPARMVPRVVLAAVAGLAVVALIFIAFGRPAAQDAHPVSPAVSPLAAQANAPPPVIVAPAQPALAVAPPPELPAPAAEPSPGDTAAMQAAQAAPVPAGPAAAHPHSRHPGTASTESLEGKRNAAAGAPPAGLGEFKTTF